jgi:hypothetical protein
MARSSIARANLESDARVDGGSANGSVRLVTEFWNNVGLLVAPLVGQALEVRGVGTTRSLNASLVASACAQILLAVFIPHAIAANH